MTWILVTWVDQYKDNSPFILVYPSVMGRTDYKNRLDSCNYLVKNQISQGTGGLEIIS